jgi:hypothetical protein
MAPESRIAFFGGDVDNFEYPRFDLDVCFFRVYADGKPLRTEHHLAWSASGARDGDLALVCGHPGGTHRAYTADHVRFLRDVEVPVRLDRLCRREVQLQVFAGRSAENARIAQGDLFGVRNARKRTLGQLAGLLDPEVVARKAAADLALLGEAPEERREDARRAFARVAESLVARRALGERRDLLAGRYHALRSDLFSIARHLVRLADEKAKPNAERLREYRESGMDSLLQEVLSPAPIHDDLEVDRLECGLTLLSNVLGSEDGVVRAATAGLSPRARAAALVHGTRLKDVAARRALVDGGSAAVRASTDPMVRLAIDVDASAREIRRRFEDEVEAVEREGYARLAEIRSATAGAGRYPDANFTLRLSCGPVKGYREGGKDVPAFTTIGGAFARMEERGGVEPFALPKRWTDRRGALALETPFNFVCTADIVGGNSGSPVLDRKGEVIGLVFDGNLGSLVWDLQYTDETARCVCVDARAVVESLRKVYDAASLADELTRR